MNQYACICDYNNVWYQYEVSETYTLKMPNIAYYNGTIVPRLPDALNPFITLLVTKPFSGPPYLKPTASIKYVIIRQKKKYLFKNVVKPNTDAANFITVIEKASSILWCSNKADNQWSEPVNQEGDGWMSNLIYTVEWYIPVKIIRAISIRYLSGLHKKKKKLTYKFLMRRAVFSCKYLLRLFFI